MMIQMSMLQRSMLQKVVAAVAVGALCAAVSACSSDANSIAAQAKSGDRKGFVSGDGTIERVAPDQRPAPLTLGGTTLGGTKSGGTTLSGTTLSRAPWQVADALGQVLVLNVWGSWCGPCVAEMPDLQQVWSQVSSAGKPVQFMGINYRDSTETAQAFLRANEITYPSLADDGGRTLLSLRGKANTTPTTLVLDRRGRIAARVSGPVTVATLSGMVNDVLGESA